MKTPTIAEIKKATEQELPYFEELERLSDALYEACEAFETHYDAQLPYGHRSPLLVQARRAMAKARELRK